MAPVAPTSRSPLLVILSEREPSGGRERERRPYVFRAIEKPFGLRDKPLISPKPLTLLRWEIHLRTMRNDSGVVAHVKQPPHRLTAVLAVVQGALVYVHAYEFIGHLGI